MKCLLATWNSNKKRRVINTCMPLSAFVPTFPEIMFQQIVGLGPAVFKLQETDGKRKEKGIYLLTVYLTTA
jgi:hypothetical protein